VKGHKEFQCYKKNPTKAPSWWKAKLDRPESVLPSIEISLALMSNIEISGVNVTALQAEKGNTMSILCDENV
jgi:hypothetical protein